MPTKIMEDAPAMDDETKTDPALAEATATLDMQPLIEAGLATEDGMPTMAGIAVFAFLQEVDWSEVAESDDEDVVACTVQDDYECVIEGEGEDATLILPFTDRLLGEEDDEDEELEPGGVFEADTLDSDALDALLDLDDLGEMFMEWADSQPHETLEDKARDASIYQALNEEPRPWKKGDFKKLHGKLGAAKVNRMLGAMIRKGAIKKVKSGAGYKGGDYGKVSGQYPGVKGPVKVKMSQKGKAEPGGMAKWANWIAKNPSQVIKAAMAANKVSDMKTDIGALKSRLATWKKYLAKLNRYLKAKKVPAKSKKHISRHIAAIKKQEARDKNKLAKAKGKKGGKPKGPGGKGPKGGPKGLAASDTTTKPAKLTEGARLAAGIGKVMGGRAPSTPVHEAKLPQNETTGARDSMTRKGGAALAGALVESHRKAQPKPLNEDSDGNALND